MTNEPNLISDMSCLSKASRAAIALSKEGRAAARSDSASAAIFPEVGTEQVRQY